MAGSTAYGCQHCKPLLHIPFSSTPGPGQTHSPQDLEHSLTQSVHTCAGAATAHGCMAAGGAAEPRSHIHQTGPAVQHPQRPAAPRIHRGAGTATGAVESHKHVTCSGFHIDAYKCGVAKVCALALGPHSFSCCVWCESNRCGAGTHASHSAMPCRTVCQPSRSAGPGRSLRHSWARRRSSCLRRSMSSRLPPPAWARCARLTCGGVGVQGVPARHAKHALHPRVRLVKAAVPRP